jgi:REP element-mobilizing transposase RayT
MEAEWPKRIQLNHQVPGWIDAPEFFITISCQERGRNQLCHREVAKHFFDSVVKLTCLNLWQCELLVLMPDHLHLLAGFSGKRHMQRVISRWKRWVSWKANLQFQTGFFDHRLRSVASACEKWTYISLNPVRAGLVDDPLDWPFRWTRKDFEKAVRSACKADPT